MCVYRAMLLAVSGALALPGVLAEATETCPALDGDCRQPQRNAKESVLLQVRSQASSEMSAKSECKPWCNWIWKNWQGKCGLSSGECSACPDCGSGGSSPSPATPAPIPAQAQTDPTQPASDLPFSAMSWNLLARQRTQDMKTCHRNPAGNQETEDQTRDRYTEAADLLVKDGADVLLLQDAEEKFFGFGPFNPFVQLRKDYGQYSCYNYEVSKTYSSGEYPLGPGPSIMLRRSLMEEHKLYQPFFRCIGSEDKRTGVGLTSRDPFCAILQFRKPFDWTIASCKFSAASLDDQFERLQKEYKVHGQIIFGIDLNDIPADEFMRKFDQSFLAEKAYIVPEDDDRAASAIDCGTQKTKKNTLFVMDSTLQVPEAASWMPPQSPFGDGSPAAVSSASTYVPMLVGGDKGTGPRY